MYDSNNNKNKNISQIIHTRLHQSTRYWSIMVFIQLLVMSLDSENITALLNRKSNRSDVQYPVNTRYIQQLCGYKINLMILSNCVCLIPYSPPPSKMEIDMLMVWDIEHYVLSSNSLYKQYCYFPCVTKFDNGENVLIIIIIGTTAPSLSSKLVAFFLISLLPLPIPVSP